MARKWQYTILNDVKGRGKLKDLRPKQRTIEFYEGRVYIDGRSLEEWEAELECWRELQEALDDQVSYIRVPRWLAFWY